MDILKFKEELFINIQDNVVDDNEKQEPEENNEISVNHLIEIISDKINNVETINDSLIEDIYLKLKNLCGEHNKKINDWFDSKYYEDLDVLKNNFKEYNNFNNLYLTKSFVITQDNINKINDII